jgi:hypothetical protein
LVLVAQLRPGWALEEGSHRHRSGSARANRVALGSRSHRSDPIGAITVAKQQADNLPSDSDATDARSALYSRHPTLLTDSSSSRLEAGGGARGPNRLGQAAARLSSERYGNLPSVEPRAQHPAPRTRDPPPAPTVAQPCWSREGQRGATGAGQAVRWSGTPFLPGATSSGRARATHSDRAPRPTTRLTPTPRPTTNLL